MQADNEELPFKEESFEAYVANFSLMIVPNHVKMLEEALRVLRPNLVAAFSVWGRKENSPYFSIIQDTLYALKNELPL